MALSTCSISVVCVLEKVHSIQDDCFEGIHAIHFDFFVKNK